MILFRIEGPTECERKARCAKLIKTACTRWYFQIMDVFVLV
jgi:hypothetical protein